MANLLPDVEAVLFDAVGTLIYPDPPAIEVYRQAGARFGVDLPRDEIALRFRSAFTEVFADAQTAATSHAAEYAKWRQVVSAVFHDTPAPLDAIFEELWTHFAQSQHWSLFAEAPDSWRELEQRGYLLGIASNYDDRLPAVLAGLPPLSECRRVFWSSRVGYAKPHPRFFQIVANALRLAPKQILLVGDDWDNDFLGAKSAGWQSVYLARDPQNAPSESISTLVELLNFLD